MSDSLPVTLCVLPDPENMGIAHEISLLSCLEAEVYAISFLLPVNGHHLQFSTYPDVEQYSPASLVVLPDPKNMSVVVEISLLSCIEAEICVISCLLPVYGRHL